MFVDRVEFEVSSGSGGAGAVSFRREKFIPKGGPDGGDGGYGGSVYFLVASNCDTLSNYRGKNKLKAQNGAQGEGKNKFGKKGEDLILTVPKGTQVIDIESGELLLDLLEVDTKYLFLEGGKGGKGNSNFKTSTNQRPTYAQKGLPGVSKKIKLELKLIADVGLAGFPNVGKSTLISVISNAKPEIANYEFTTLTPNLGVVDVDSDASFVVADIPGIIEGASDGKGLGLEFLRHIERTKVNLFMIDVGNYRDIKTQFTSLKNELNLYSEVLGAKRFAVALSKIDQFEKDEIDGFVKEFLKIFKKKPNRTTKSNYLFWESEESKPNEPSFVLPISSAVGTNVDELKALLFHFVKGDSDI